MGLGYNSFMETLDLLIAKFKEVKEELAKDNSIAPLHDTVEGFMGGLKTMPKGSVQRGRFITQHMNHPAFIGALNSHPQGKQMHSMLMGHLNSAANAGPKAFGGATVSIAKSEEDPLEELEKYFSPRFLFGASKPKTQGTSVTPAKLTGSDKIAAVSKQPIQSMSSPAKAAGAVSGDAARAPAPKLTGLDRIKAESQRPIEGMTSKVKKDEDDEEDKDLEKGLFGMGSRPVEKKPFVPSFKGHAAAIGSGASTGSNGVTTERSFDPLKQQTSQKKFVSVSFGKTVNGSMGPDTNMSSMQMSTDEKLSLNKGGQWSLEKDGMSDAIKALKSSTKVTGAMNTMRAANPGMPKPAPIMKGEDEKGRCDSCGSKACVGDCKDTSSTAANNKHLEGFKNKIKMDKAEHLCPKCHAKKCQCNKEGILVD